MSPSTPVLAPPNGISFRPYLAEDTAELCDLVRASILDIASEDYSNDQCEVWVASLADPVAMAARFAQNLTLVAVSEGEIAGFITLKSNQHIDLLFTEPRFARRGIATFLCGAIEMLAAGRKSTKLLVDASDTASGLFASLGFKPMQRNTVSLHGQWLANTTMQKELSASPAPTSN